MRSNASGPAAMPALLAAAGLALMLGTAVYLLDRPQGSAWLIPSAWQAALPGHWFGSVGLWLPSLVHAFAFSVLTALLLPRRPAFAATACLGWALIDTLAEIGQHAAISATLAAAIEQAVGGATWAARLGQYFTRGSFDPADVAAAIAGSALAYALLRRYVPSEGAPRSIAGREKWQPSSDILKGSST